MEALVGEKSSEQTSIDIPHVPPSIPSPHDNVNPVDVTASPVDGAGVTGTTNRTGETQSTQLSEDHLSTPEVQRVIVENIVKTSEVASHSHLSYKLKPFSGRVPLPSYESDYDAWRSSVELCLSDPMISDPQIVRKIMESLSAPASSIVKSLGPRATAMDYLTLLDSAYAMVEDGDELFARFLNTNQNLGEKASDYCQRLYNTLSLVIRRKRIAPAEADKQLLRQFIRGCWDSQLLNSLQLEQRRSHPPPFSEIPRLLCTEEEKLASKAARMKQHFGITKTKALSHSQITGIPVMDNTYLDSSSTDITTNLMEQIAKLTAQVSQLQAYHLALNNSTAQPKLN